MGGLLFYPHYPLDSHEPGFINLERSETAGWWAKIWENFKKGKSSDNNNDNTWYDGTLW